MKNNNEHIPHPSERLTSKIRALRHALIADLEQKNVPDALNKVWEACNKWAMRMQKQHDDYQNVRTYHIMVGSTPPAYATADDFEGEDSAFAFLARLRGEMLGDNA